MNLKMQTDFALRTLIYLAFRKEQVPVEEISTTYRISKDHLVKVVQSLVRLGYVQSRSGRNGGIRLAKDAGSINVGTVVGEFEGRQGLLPCVGDVSYCNLEPGCALRSMLIKAEEAFYQTLGRMTIGELIQANVAKGSGGVYNLTINRTLPAPAPALETRST
jgi:Rrf2 family nitric oxide-sensitive transcriptional repressor